MRNMNTTVLGLLLAATSALAACNSSNGSSTTGEPNTGSSQARVVASAQGSGSTTMHVTATDNGSSTVAIDKMITVAGGSSMVLDESVAAGTYTFKVDVLQGTASIATNSAQATLTDGVTTQIAFAAQAGGDDGGTAGTETVQIGVDVAPQITGVEVTASGTGATTMTQVHVDATDPTGGALTFYWSGAGLAAAVQGTDTMSISTTAITAAITTSPVLHVVAQDATGASTAVDVDLAVAAGAVTGTISSAMSAAASLQACLDTQAQCNAACSPGIAIGSGTVSIDASCLSACSMSLLSCQAQ